MALALYNEFELEIVPDEPSLLDIVVTGEGQGRIPLDENNLIVRACRRVWEEAGRPVRVGVRARLHNRIPTGSGLGSSASAIVGGLVGGNRLAGDPLTPQRLLEIATEMEGHPDNVAAALFGGVTLAVARGPGCWSALPCPRPGCGWWWASLTFSCPPGSPGRRCPRRCPFEDAVFNVGRTALLIAALTQDRLDLLGLAMEDRLHHPYRRRLVPGMEAAFQAAKEAGALGVALERRGAHGAGLHPSRRRRGGGGRAPFGPRS